MALNWRRLEVRWARPSAAALVLALGLALSFVCWHVANQRVHQDAAAKIASVVPAWRATHVDPATVLRDD